MQKSAFICKNIKHAFMIIVSETVGLVGVSLDIIMHTYFQTTSNITIVKDKAIPSESKTKQDCLLFQLIFNILH